VKAALLLLIAGAFATTPPQHSWTLAQARSVLEGKTYDVIDVSQADRPEYQLQFSPRAVKSLGKRFVFAGLAHDAFTDQDVRVRFNFKRPGRITDFRGPAADSSQPSFPIHATFYYAWYPEAWLRDPVFPYSDFHPSLDYYSDYDTRIVREHIRIDTREGRIGRVAIDACIHDRRTGQNRESRGIVFPRSGAVSGRE